MAAKTTNQKAWLFVLPVVVLVALNALIPLMTVVNYSVQETFGDNVFFFEGVKWFEQVLHSERFHAALLRQLAFANRETHDVDPHIDPLVLELLDDLLGVAVAGLLAIGH